MVTAFGQPGRSAVEESGCGTRGNCLGYTGWNDARKFGLRLREYLRRRAECGQQVAHALAADAGRVGQRRPQQ